MSIEKLETSSKNEEIVEVFPTCKCGWQNTNFPGIDAEIICTPCQLKEKEEKKKIIEKI